MWKKLKLLGLKKNTHPIIYKRISYRHAIENGNYPKPNPYKLVNYIPINQGLHYLLALNLFTKNTKSAPLKKHVSPQYLLVLSSYSSYLACLGFSEFWYSIFLY